jgi:hypothetical protein
MTKRMLRRLAQAAAMRARARSWVEVAKAVNARVDVCRRWPDKYPTVWRALMNEAERMVFEEITAEALWVLTRMARSADPKERVQAERLLEEFADKLGKGCRDL